MSIQTVEIRAYSGPDLVTLQGTGRPAIVRLNVGPAGPAGPNSVTSATTSDGTASLNISEMDVQSLNAINQFVAGGTIIFAGDLFTYPTLNGAANHRAALSIGSLASLNNDSTGDILANTIETAGDATINGTLTADHIHGNLAGSVYAHVRAGETLAKGDPVYISGSHGSGETLIPIVSKADASNAAKMPAVGIMDAALANNANGHMVITGTITDLNTNAYAVNSVLYVATGGGFTATPPAANSQAVAIVERSNTNNGAVIVKVNGLASSGGNGVSDANKLVRFGSAGTIPVASIGGLGTGVATALAVNTGSAGAFVVNGGTATDMTLAGSAAFTSTTRPTSAGTGTPAATSLITRDDTDLLRLQTSNFVVSNFTGATAVAGGGAASVATLLYAASNCSTTPGNYFTYLLGNTFFSGNINGDRTTANLSRKIIMIWDIIVVTVPSAGNSESRYLWPVNSTYTTGRLTAKGFGFIVINTTVYGCSHDGTTHYLTSGITFGANTLHTCTAISNGAGSVSFYVDGTLLGTLTGPTGTQANARSAAINCEAGSSGVNQWFACQQFQLITRI